MIRGQTQQQVKRVSDTFIGTCGESKTACQQRFMPAFRSEHDGRIELARLPDGRPAPMHLIIALPREWAARVDADGGVLQLIDGITAGFCRDGAFYTREEAAQAG
ncbi:MAG: hypothetical protein RIC89_19865 [Pseudomonadales bacterium]